MCSKFCDANVETLKEYEIKRVTFIIIRSKEFPKYFTYRARLQYKYVNFSKSVCCYFFFFAKNWLLFFFCREDRVYRHLEPALAFQLELNRLKNYDLAPVQVSNHKMHLYFATAKKLSPTVSKTLLKYTHFYSNLLKLAQKFAKIYSNLHKFTHNLLKFT